MRFVIDTNEFLFTLGTLKSPHSEDLIHFLITSSPKHSVSIPRTVFVEVRNNLRPIFFTQFLRLVNAANITVDEDELIPYELGSKYEHMGLKPADAMIASYTEYIGADILLSENRHFIARQPDLPFKVLTAEKALKLLKK